MLGSYGNGRDSLGGYGRGLGKRLWWLGSGREDEYGEDRGFREF